MEENIGQVVDATKQSYLMTQLKHNYVYEDSVYTVPSSYNDNDAVGMSENQLLNVAVQLRLLIADGNPVSPNSFFIYATSPDFDKLEEMAKIEAHAYVIQSVANITGFAHALTSNYRLPTETIPAITHDKPFQALDWAPVIKMKKSGKLAFFRLLRGCHPTLFFQPGYYTKLSALNGMLIPQLPSKFMMAIMVEGHHLHIVILQNTLFNKARLIILPWASNNAVDAGLFTRLIKRVTKALTITT